MRCFACSTRRTRSELPGDKQPQLRCLFLSIVCCHVFSFARCVFSFVGGFTDWRLQFEPPRPPYLRHQIRHRATSRSPPPERVAPRERTLISYALAQTEKELRGAEMLLLLAKLIHLHATLSPWQFHNKSRETPPEAGQRGPPLLPCPRLSA